ncbi:ROK family transcriptional regulator [Amycolatopsis sp. H20-H5]|uniref:ROK family transcriptional regulator n=1 Tax=Amycolatopsis sp. H20-H5 TaxID=3046309 RepID=UPI002DB715C3|nr:ROK family transcriptional regulator [Amycolatopsis sp. H20-H5]MEC3975268.1 ROK family transcriptional regulator [Amycolatopsis sp. H20-H5]
MRAVRQTTRDLRRRNRATLLSSLYLDGPVSRLELGRESGLSPATVTNVVAELIGDGVVAEAGLVESDGGRPRTLLRIRSEFGQVIGVDVGETRVRVGLFDCLLETIATVSHPLGGTPLDPEEVAGVVLTGIGDVLGQRGTDPASVFGIGIGVPGAVREGGIVHAPTLGWSGVGFADLLRQGVSAPLYLDNCARTLGQAEMWRGAGKGAERAVIALLGVGVGAAMATGGDSFSGVSSTTAEWGHTVVQAGGLACRCGSRGCLEAYTGSDAIVRAYHRLPGAEPILATGSEAMLAELVERAGSPGPAAAALDRAAEYLGIGIANLVNLLGPDRVVLAGWAGAMLGPAILPAVRDAVGRHALSYLSEQTEVVLGALGTEAVALGAATLPIAELLASGGRSAG